MGLKCYAAQYMDNGEEISQIASSPWYFVTPPEKDWATAIGNIKKKYGKHPACGLGDILANRHIHRPADHNTLQPIPRE